MYSATEQNIYILCQVYILYYKNSKSSKLFETDRFSGNKGEEDIVFPAAVA